MCFVRFSNDKYMCFVRFSNMNQGVLAVNAVLKVMRQQSWVAVVFFYSERHERPEKISWDEQRIPAVKAASHKIFSCYYPSKSCFS